MTRAVAVLVVLVAVHAAEAGRATPVSRWIVRAGSDLSAGLASPAALVLETGDGSRGRADASVVLVSLADGAVVPFAAWTGRSLRKARGRWEIRASPTTPVLGRMRAHASGGALRVRVGRGRTRLRLRATPSRCGDQVFDPGNEQCEQETNCASGRCVACACVGWQRDPAFGTGGTTVIERVGGPLDAIQRPDGRVAILVRDAATSIRVVQLHPDGRIDAGFAEDGDPDGVLDTGLGGGTGQAVLGADGSLLVVGGVGEQTLLRRFDDAGRIDAGFGDAGSLVLDDALIVPRASLPDGDVPIVIGESLGRLRPDGALEPGLGLVPWCRRRTSASPCRRVRRQS